MPDRSTDTFIDSLTPREMDVLTLLADGLSNQEIANTLVFEVATVKWYANQIYSKLHVKNRKEAVIRARTLGLLQSHPANPADPSQRLQHNLPADPLTFIGRQHEITDLIHHLTGESVRLVTILGPGGMGKTRLSIEVGRQLLGHFPDGVYFVPLAAVTSTDQMVTTLAQIIGFKFGSDLPPHQQLAAHLQPQHLLLIIDNFEHLLDSAPLLTDLLRTAPHLKLLVTSREKLGLGGEVVYGLEGLATPADDQAALPLHDAVNLFIDAAHRTAAPLHSDQMETVARICRMLGGMPLAILLAAAWLDTLSLAEIEAELKRGPDILETTLRDAPQRHQSIEAVFDSSWNRLPTPEQRVFMRLSVFRGGFTREAAQAVAGAGLRALQHLVHTSFLQHQPSGRYVIHELMRQYGEQKLAASGERTATREAHARYFASFIAPIGEAVWHLIDDPTLEKVGVDFENVRAGWNFYLETRQVGGLQGMLDGIWHFLDRCSRSQEAVDLFEAAFDVFPPNDGSQEVTFFRGHLLSNLGWFYGDIGQKPRSMALFEHARAVLEPFGTTGALLQTYVGLAIMLHFTNRPRESLTILEKGLELSRASGNARWQITFYDFLARTHDMLGNEAESQYWLQYVSDSPLSLGMRSELLTRQGNYAQAEELLLEGLRYSGRHRYSTIARYGQLIENAVLAGQYEKAWGYLQRGLHHADDTTYAWGGLELLDYALSLLVAEEHYASAVEIKSLIMHHPAATDVTRDHATRYDDRLAARLPADDYAAAWARGQHLDLGDLITDLMER